MLTRTVTTRYVCTVCRAPWVHVEVMPEGDEPYGLPLDLRFCDCGGGLLVLEDASAGGAPAGLCARQGATPRDDPRRSSRQNGVNRG